MDSIVEKKIEDSLINIIKFDKGKIMKGTIPAKSSKGGFIKNENRADSDSYFRKGHAGE